MNIKKLSMVVGSTIILATSQNLSAAAFNFADIANGDNTYGVTGGEYGAPSISFSKDGVNVTATASDSITGASYNPYLDSSWTHSGGGGNGGLGVCKNLTSTNQCTPSSDDNVTLNENLLLTFDTAVTITGITFRNGEHNPVFAQDAFFDLSIDAGSDTQYSLVHLFNTPLTGTTFEFKNLNITDTDDYRFYISAMEVTAVPVPAAVWLFGSGLLALAGFVRKRKYC